MHAYDFILILFSFVYAAAITHLLSTAGEIIIASKRVRFSWFNAGWMCAALLFTCAWWIGLWDLRTTTIWNVGAIAFYFLVAAGIYLNARLVSPRIPEKSEIDLRAFHVDEGQKYLIAYTILSVVTVHYKRPVWSGWQCDAMAGSEHRHRPHDSCHRHLGDLYQEEMGASLRGRDTNRGLALVLRQTSVRTVRLAIATRA